MTRKAKKQAVSVGDILKSAVDNLDVNEKGRLLTDTAFRVLSPFANHLREQSASLMREDMCDIYAYIIFSYFLPSIPAAPVSGKLAGILTSSRCQALVQQIKQFFDGLPYTYDLMFPLPLVTWNGADEQLFAGVRLVNAAREDVIDTPRSSDDIVRLSELVMQKKPGNIACLKIETSGFMCMGEASEIPALSAIRKAKVVLQLAHVLGIFAATSPATLTPTFASYRQVAFPENISEHVALPRTFASALRRFVLSTTYRTATSFQGAFSSIGTVLERDEQWNSKTKTKEDPDIVNRHCARIATAAEWLFDATHDDNPAMAFVQTSIGFETLYGGEEGDKEPIVSTLSNRVAYSLGKTPVQRANIAKVFKKFYNTRSRVVHNGNSRLSSSEASELLHGKELLRTALRHELALLNEPKGLGAASTA